MATFPGREGVLAVALDSLRNQTRPPDAVHLYHNGKRPDLTDNGKFYGLREETDPCYYLTCDDDIIYPPDYIERMVAAIRRHGGVVTHYGRILRGEASNYYHRDCFVHRLIERTKTQRLDIPGTGVSGWFTGDFNFERIIYETPHKMTDCHLGMVCAEYGIPITGLPHAANYIREIPLPRMATIHGTMIFRDHEQARIANEIWKLNYVNRQQTRAEG
jgi:hypothetical protein